VYTAEPSQGGGCALAETDAETLALAVRLGEMLRLGEALSETDALGEMVGQLRSAVEKPLALPATVPLRMNVASVLLNSSSSDSVCPVSQV